MVVYLLAGTWRHSLLCSHWREAKDRSSNHLLDKTYRSNDWLLENVAPSLGYQLAIKHDMPTTNKYSDILQYYTFTIVLPYLQYSFSQKYLGK